MSSAAALRGAAAPVAREDVGQLLGRDAGAVVGDGELHGVAGEPASHLDCAAGGRELDRVAEEVRDHLADADRVVANEDRRIRGVHGELRNKTKVFEPFP